MTIWQPIDGKKGKHLETVKIQNWVVEICQM